MSKTAPLVCCPLCGDSRIEAEIESTSNERINATCFHCHSRWQVDIKAINYAVLEDNSDKLPWWRLVK